MIVDLATGEIMEPVTSKNPATVELGRLGGLKGGKARAEKLSPERRKEITPEGYNESFFITSNYQTLLQQIPQLNV